MNQKTVLVLSLIYSTIANQSPVEKPAATMPVVRDLLVEMTGDNAG